ncbi:MAG: hypothetical protein ACLSHC_05460 [Bilophila wadsworthia]
MRTHAFTPDIDADGRRLGWVALGDPLDTDGFELASVDGRYSGFPSGWTRARRPGPLSGSSLPKPFGRNALPAKGWEQAQEELKRPSPPN